MKFAGNPGFRLLQIFLGRSTERAQVYEVYLEFATDRLFCTCPGFKLRNGCKHTTFVADQVEVQGGYIAAIMREDAELTKEVLHDPVAFRDWLYTNAKVLMLE